MNREDVRLNFYIVQDGIPTMADSEIFGLIDRAEKDGVLEYVFYGNSKYTKEMYLHKLKAEPQNNLFFTVYVKEELAGFGHLDNMRFDHAGFHFCVFSEFWGRPETVEASIEVYRILHEKRYSLLIGVIPIDNIYAIKFCEKIKLQRTCILPRYFYNDKSGEHVDGVQFISVRGGN